MGRIDWMGGVGMMVDVGGGGSGSGSGGGRGKCRLPVTGGVTYLSRLLSSLSLHSFGAGQLNGSCICLGLFLYLFAGLFCLYLLGVYIMGQNPVITYLRYLFTSGVCMGQVNAVMGGFFFWIAALGY